MPAAELLLLLLGLPIHAANVILTSQQLQASGPRLHPQRATDPQEKGFPKTIKSAFSSPGQKSNLARAVVTHIEEIQESFHRDWSFCFSQEFIRVFLGSGFSNGRGKGKEGKYHRLSLKICFLSCRKLQLPNISLSVPMIPPHFLNLEEATELELSVWQSGIGGKEEEVRRCKGVTDSKH